MKRQAMTGTFQGRNRSRSSNRCQCEEPRVSGPTGGLEQKGSRQYANADTAALQWTKSKATRTFRRRDSWRHSFGRPAEPQSWWPDSEAERSDDSLA